MLSSNSNIMWRGSFFCWHMKASWSATRSCYGWLLCLDSGRQQSPTQLTPCQWNGGDRSEKACGLRQSLLGKAKTAQSKQKPAKRNMEFTHDFSRASQVLSYFQERRALSCVTVTCEDKHCTSKCPSFLIPSPHLLLLNRTSCGMEYPFGQSGSDFVAVTLPSLLCTLSPLTGGAVWGSIKDLDALYVQLSNN